MDQSSLQIICSALQKQVPGKFITKIHQMTPWHLLLRLRGGPEGEQRLLIAVSPRDFGLHITSHRYLNPPRPLRFCAFLRRHLQGAKIISLEKIPADRIVVIRAARRHEKEEKTLIIEFTGRIGNVIYCQGEKNLIKSIMLEKNGRGRLLQGAGYRMPDNPVSNSLEHDFLLGGLSSEPLEKIAASDLHKLYDNWFFPRYRADYGLQEVSRQLKRLRRHVKKLNKLQNTLETERENKKSHSHDHLHGDLLKSCLGRVSKGMTSIEVTNYWSAELEKVEIPLNPALSPTANLERFYQQAKKARRGLEIISQRLSESQAEKEYTVELIFQLEELLAGRGPSNNSGEQELLDLTAELGRLPVSKSGGSGPKKKSKKTDDGVDRLTGVAGGTIFIGRNAIGNENIYRHLGSADDYWFHIRGCPGAHVLLKCSGNQLQESEKMQAADLAAESSRARQETRVQVDMTKIKYLRKSHGARPGQVVFSQPPTTISLRRDCNHQTNKAL